MIKILGELYYIDIDKVQEIITIPNTSPDNSEQNISVVKFEMIKTMIDVIMTENEDIDESLGSVGTANLSVPFKLAFNTLLMYQILNKI